MSRSVSTICAALVLGMKRDDAARFSLLLGIPAITGAGLYEMHDALHNGADAVPAILIGSAVAAVASYASISWLLRYLRRNSLNSFGVYRIALWILLVVLCLSGVVQPLWAWRSRRRLSERAHRRRSRT